MKKFIFTACAFFLTFICLAQKIKIDEGSSRIGGGTNNAFTVTIFEANEEQIAKEWKSLMKKNDAKVTINSNEVFADNAVIKAFESNNTVDVYAVIEKVKEGEVKLTVAFDLGGAFLSSSDHKSKANEAKEILHNFAVRVTKEAIEDHLKAEQKLLKKVNNQQEDLVKQNERLVRTIEDSKKEIVELQEKIKKAEQDIVLNKKDQEKKKIEVEAQQKVVNAVSTKLESVN